MYCSKCKRPLQRQDNYCPHCGAKIDWSKADGQKTDSPMDREDQNRKENSRIEEPILEEKIFACSETEPEILEESVLVEELSEPEEDAGHADGQSAKPESTGLPPRFDKEEPDPLQKEEPKPDSLNQESERQPRPTGHKLPEPEDVLPDLPGGVRRRKMPLLPDEQEPGVREMKAGFKEGWQSLKDPQARKNPEWKMRIGMLVLSVLMILFACLPFATAKAGLFGLSISRSVFLIGMWPGWVMIVLLIIFAGFTILNDRKLMMIFSVLPGITLILTAILSLVGAGTALQKSGYGEFIDFHLAIGFYLLLISAIGLIVLAAKYLTDLEKRDPLLTQNRPDAKPAASVQTASAPKTDAAALQQTSSEKPDHQPEQ